MATREPWDSGQGQVVQGQMTYDEILKQDLDSDERQQVRGEATLALAVALLLQRGAEDVVRPLIDVIRLDVEGNDDNWGPDYLWLEVAPEHLGGFETGVVEKIRETCDEVSKRRDYYITFAGVREILPDAGPGWRESLRRQLSGEKSPTNHARRVRTGPARYTEDGLSFTNEAELTVYRALRKIQETYPSDDTLGIFPLAGGRISRKTWEPDVLVTYKGRAGVLEIDGPYHNRRRAMDMTRDHMWRDAGVAFVDRIPVESLSNPKELEASLRRFLKRLAETR